MNAAKVVTSPELLHLIFSSSVIHSVAIGMQVCKFWAEVAKPVLWRVVDSDEQFVGLLRILAPWNFEEKFSIPPSLEWPRFLGCSKLVHTLEIDWTMYSDPEIMTETVYSVLEFIFKNCPVSDVFPNLYTLECFADQDTRHATILFHSAVRRWCIQFDNYEDRVDPSVPLIPTNPIQQLFGIVELEIGYGVIVDDLLATFVALKELPCLRNVVLPYYTVSYAVLEALSMCQTLEEIRTRFRASSCACKGKHFLPRTFRKGAFPALTKLTISGCSYMISRLLDDENFPFHIASLAVECSICTENPSSSVYSKITSKCPNVTDFVLRDIVEDKPSLFSSLRGFLSYELTRLRVDTEMQLEYAATNIEELACSLPKIEFLCLAPEPSMSGPPFGTFTFDHLRLFARHCPKLMKLAILVDTTHACESLMENDVVPFSVLQELDLGSTFLIDTLANTAAILLARLLPAHCQVIFNLDAPSAPAIKRAISNAREAKREKESGERAPWAWKNHTALE